jgi:hypothetical protein
MMLRSGLAVFRGDESLDSLKVVAALLLSLTTTALTAESPKLSADQLSVLEDARAFAVQYVQRLPDFICTQTTRRHVTARLPVGFGAGSLDETNDIIEEQLAYVGGKEKYTVLTLNGQKATGVVHAQLDEAISWGEFGSLSWQIFDPASHTVFSWDREERINGRHAWAFKYRVPKESGTTIIDQRSDKTVVVSYSGKVLIDPETKSVLEITSTLDVPGTFPIRNVTRMVLYTDQEIGGKKYCLPLRSEMHMEEGTKLYDNQIDFKDYHHFASESTIHFDAEGAH